MKTRPSTSRPEIQLSPQLEAKKISFTTSWRDLTRMKFSPASVNSLTNILGLGNFDQSKDLQFMADDEAMFLQPFAQWKENQPITYTAAGMSSDDKKLWARRLIHQVLQNRQAFRELLKADTIFNFINAVLADQSSSLPVTNAKQAPTKVTVNATSSNPSRTKTSRDMHFISAERVKVQPKSIAEVWQFLAKGSIDRIPAVDFICQNLGLGSFDTATDMTPIDFRLPQLKESVEVAKREALDIRSDKELRSWIYLLVNKFDSDEVLNVKELQELYTNPENLRAFIGAYRNQGLYIPILQMTDKPVTKATEKKEFSIEIVSHYLGMLKDSRTESLVLPMILKGLGLTVEGNTSPDAESLLAKIVTGSLDKSLEASEKKAVVVAALTAASSDSEQTSPWSMAVNLQALLNYILFDRAGVLKLEKRPEPLKSLLDYKLRDYRLEVNDNGKKSATRSTPNPAPRVPSNEAQDSSKRFIDLLEFCKDPKNRRKAAVRESFVRLLQDSYGIAGLCNSTSKTGISDKELLRLTTVYSNINDLIPLFEKEVNDNFLRFVVARVVQLAFENSESSQVFNSIKSNLEIFESNFKALVSHALQYIDNTAIVEARSEQAGEANQAESIEDEEQVD